MKKPKTKRTDKQIKDYIDWRKNGPKVHNGKPRKVAVQMMHNVKESNGHGEQLAKIKHTGNGDVCTTCGGPHWSPDCPVTARLVHDPVFRARNELEKALAYVRKLGFSPQINNVPFTLNDIYLRPVDGSDKLTCSCCGNPYEAKKQQFRGTLPTPLNWCFSCRELLRERNNSPMDVWRMFHKQRRRKDKLIRASEARVRAWVQENQKRKPTTHSVK